MQLSSINKDGLQLRLRVFAGPNGSGKSTLIKSIQTRKINGRSIDVGFYVNSDDIAEIIRKKQFSFDQYFTTSENEFREVALASGLVSNKRFTLKRFNACYSFSKNSIKLKVPQSDEALAQIIADFLHKKLFELRTSFLLKPSFLMKESYTSCARLQKQDTKYISILLLPNHLLSIIFGYKPGS